MQDTALGGRPRSADVQQDELEAFIRECDGCIVFVCMSTCFMYTPRHLFIRMHPDMFCVYLCTRVDVCSHALLLIYG